MYYWKNSEELRYFSYTMHTILIGIIVSFMILAVGWFLKIEGASLTVIRWAVFPALAATLIVWFVCLDQFIKKEERAAWRTHKDVRILFEVGGRKFEAVGFLEEGESSIPFYRLSLLVQDAIRQEDVDFLLEHCEGSWGRDLSFFKLATESGGPDHFCFFSAKYSGRELVKFYRPNDLKLDNCWLVVRRCE